MPVYFIQDEGGEIKIGYSDGNPYRRLNAFKTGNPRELKMLVSIPGGREEEQALHERFADLRVKGEWFRPDPRLLGFIEGMKYAHADKQPEPVEDDEPKLFGLHVEQLEAIAGWLRAKKLHDDAAQLDDLNFSCRDEIDNEAANEAYRLRAEEWWIGEEIYTDKNYDQCRPYWAGAAFYLLATTCGDDAEPVADFVKRAAPRIIDLYEPPKSPASETH